MINQDLLRKLDLIKLKKLANKSKDINHLKNLKKLSYTTTHSYHKTKIKEDRKKIEKEKLSEENSLFIDSYHKIRKLFPLKIENSFKDLLKKYNERGYETPNFSPDQSLFTQNPLLLPNEKLNEYYMLHTKRIKLPKFYSKLYKKNKHLSFLEKEKKYVDEQLRELKKIKKKKIFQQNSQTNLNKTQQYNGVNFLTLLKDSAMNVQLKEENEKIKVYNEKIEKIIPSLKIRHTSFKPKKIQLLHSKSKIQFSTFKSYNLDESSFITPRNYKRKQTHIINDSENKNINKCNSKFLNFKNNKIENLKKKNIINKFETFLISLYDENEQDKFLNELQDIDLTQLSRKDLEKIAKTYCQKFLKLSDLALKDLLNPKYSDNDLIRLINNFIFCLDNSEKVKYDLIRNNSINGKLIDLQKENKILKQRFAIFVANKSFE